MISQSLRVRQLLPGRGCAADSPALATSPSLHTPRRPISHGSPSTPALSSESQLVTLREQEAEEPTTSTKKRGTAPKKPPHVAKLTVDGVDLLRTETRGGAHGLQGLIDLAEKYCKKAESWVVDFSGS